VKVVQNGTFKLCGERVTAYFDQDGKTSVDISIADFSLSFLFYIPHFSQSSLKRPFPD